MSCSNEPYVVPTSGVPHKDLTAAAKRHTYGNVAKNDRTKRTLITMGKHSATDVHHKNQPTIVDNTLCSLYPPITNLV